MTELLAQLMPNGITRKISLRAAYDTLESDMRGGIHNAEIFFSIARGDAGVEWAFSTGWHLRKTREREPNPAMRAHRKTYQEIFAPDGLGTISTHSPVPLYKDQSCDAQDCMFTHGPCYAGSTYMASGELFDKFVADPEVLWADLEARLERLEAAIAAERQAARDLS